MKLILFADKQVGFEVTELLINEYPGDLGLVVTMSENNIFRAARNANIACCIFNSSNDLCEHIRALGLLPDLGILAWWPKVIEEDLLIAATHGFVNFHPSLLPYNRGKHYNFWAIVERAPFGVTLHFADKEVDSGDIIFQKSITYSWTDTGSTLYHKAQKEIVELFREHYPILRTLKIPRKKQDLSRGSFHRASELDQISRIDLEQSYNVRQLLNLLRARTFEGFPACWFEDEGKKYEVRIQIKEK